jgi:SOS-response transcriptional repressor LexA
MTTWVERTKLRMQELGITQEALANKMGITRGAITHYLAGRRVPPLNQFTKLAAILKVQPAWLQFGVSKEEPLYRPAVKKEKMEKDSYPLPILTWKEIADTAGAISRNKIKEFLPHFSVDQPNWYGLRVIGDAMTTPLGQNKNFHEGDIIIIDPDKKAAHGSFVIALLPRAKEATFKQYVVDGGVPYLKPLNPQYPLIETNKNTHICGVVVASLSF